MENTIVKFISNEKGFIAALISAVIVLVFGRPLFYDLSNYLKLLVLFVFLFSIILSAAIAIVHHAEALAHKYGEPYGTLILTLSVIGIEVIMIAVVMLNAENQPTMARDTMYSVIMIVTNGLIGLAMILGGLKHGEQRFNLKSSNSFFSMIIAFVTLGLILPNFIPPTYLESYYIFLIVISTLLYILFLRIQTFEHSYFFTFGNDGDSSAQTHIEAKEDISGVYHALMLILTLIPLIVLAKSLAVVLDYGIEITGAPVDLAALIVALLILSPEGLTAIRAGRNNEMQRVVNIGLGSALATIGMTIPVVLIISFIANKDIDLGLDSQQATLLIATILVGMNTYKDGETNMLQGAIHFVLFATFIALIFF